MLGQACTFSLYPSRQSTRVNQSPPPRDSPLRSFLLPCQLAEAFSPHAHPSFQRSSTYSPSNPFCRRRLFPVSTSPARRLDYTETRYAAEIRWLRETLRELWEWISDLWEYDTLVNICFWAALVVFISTIYGLGTTSTSTSTDPSSLIVDQERIMLRGLNWRDEYHNHLENIWEADIHL
jgi:hypothetical protein